MEMGTVEAKRKEHRIYQYNKALIEKDIIDSIAGVAPEGLHRPYSIHDVFDRHDAVMRMMEERPIYRLNIHDRTGKVDIHCYDLLENFAPELDKEYNSINDLPKWAQEKLAVLMVLDPSIINNDIEDVGRRISRNVYWLYKEIENGNDPRREG